MISRDKPEPCFTSGCPLAKCLCGHGIDVHNEEGGHCEFVTIKETKKGRGKAAERIVTERKCECKQFKSKGRGFVLGTGSPESARVAIWVEAPGTEEVAYSLGNTNLNRTVYDNDELERRRVAYPGIPERFLKRGAPLVGKSGAFTDQQILAPVGLAHEDVFIDNTLRCLPPKKKNGAYPIGDERKEAEKCCRQYDRWDQFSGDLAVVAIHPAAMLREITPLPLNNKAGMQRAVDFSKQGYKVIVTMGGKAAKACLGYAEHVLRYVGEYKWLRRKVNADESPSS